LTSWAWYVSVVVALSAESLFLRVVIKAGNVDADRPSEKAPRALTINFAAKIWYFDVLSDLVQM
jgi:hypothetical protein